MTTTMTTTVSSTPAEPDGRYYLVTANDPETGAAYGLSRRDGDDFDGPWRLLTEEEASELAKVVNDDGGKATVVEVYRYDGDP